MKKLPGSDTTISGYSVVTASLLLATMPVFDGRFGSVVTSFVAVGMGMLGVATLADRRGSGFISDNRWLMRLIYIAIFVPPLCHLASELIEGRLGLSVFEGLIVPILFMPLWYWYYRENAQHAGDDTKTKS